MALWTPSALTILPVGWFEAATLDPGTGAITDGVTSGQITLNGPTVSAWANRGSGTWAATQGTGALQPAYTASSINGLPGLTFDGVDDFLTGGTGRVPASPEHNYFVVFKSAVTPGATTYGLVASAQNSSNREFLTLSNPSTPNGYWGYSATSGGVEDTRVDAPNTITAGYAAIAHMQFNADGTSIYENGTLLGSQNTGASPTQASSANEFRIGQRFASNWTLTFNGDIAEVIVTTHALTTDERQQIEGYLAWKWGLQASLPAGHPYKTAAPTVANLWTPAYLNTRPVYWFDADAPTTLTVSAPNVTSWQNRGTAGGVASQATGTNQPEIGTAPNGKPCLVWPNALNQKHLQTNTAAAVQEWYTVAQFADGALNSFSTATYVGVLGASGQSYMCVGDPVTPGVTNAFLWISGQGIFQDYRRNGGSLLNTAARAAVLPMPLGILTQQHTSALTPTNWIIGADRSWSQNRGWWGLGAEWIGLAATASTDDRQRLEGYLAWKWGTQALLAADHPYKTAAPTLVPAGGGSQAVTLAPFTARPSFNAITLVPGPVSLSVTPFTARPTFSGLAITPGGVTLEVTAFTARPSFGALSVSQGPVTLTVTPAVARPTFGALGINPGPVSLSVTPFDTHPSFGALTVTVGAVTLTVTPFDAHPSFGALFVEQPGTGGGGVTASQIWNYPLEPGLTVGQAIAGIYHALTSGNVNVNIARVNDVDVIGTGTQPDPWRGN